MTIRDIAREAGVSTATVSRALRGLPNVDPRTAARVMRVVERYDYVISPSASRLASGRTGAVAALTPHISSWYFSTLLSGAEPLFQTAGLDLLLVGTGVTHERYPRSPPRALRRKVDGFLVLGSDVEPQVTDSIGALRLPAVLVGAYDVHFDSVYVDDVEGARCATGHLLDLGHRRVALVAGDPSPNPGPDRDRRLGYLKALGERGLIVDPDLTEFGGFSTAGAEAATGRLLLRPQRPSAVFAASDEMALGVIRAIRSAGLAPGREISVVGYDGHPLAEQFDLTTVAQPIEKMGDTGARLLVEQLQQPSPATRRVQLATALIRRGSSGAPHARSARARRTA